VFALVVHDAVIVVVATLDPLVVLAAADAAAVSAVAAVAAAAAAVVCTAVPVLGMSVDEDGGFRRGGGVGGVNCRSIPS